MCPFPVFNITWRLHQPAHSVKGKCKPDNRQFICWRSVYYRTDCIIVRLTTYPILCHLLWIYISYCAKTHHKDKPWLTEDIKDMISRRPHPQVQLLLKLTKLCKIARRNIINELLLKELLLTVTTKTTLLNTIYKRTTESTGTLLNVFHSVQTTTNDLL